MIRVAGIADSPKLNTGFANVAREIFKGFGEEFEFSAFGILDWTPDIKGLLPYFFWPTSQIDQMGYSESLEFVRQVEPDIVWIMIDPGNLTKWVNGLIDLNQEMKQYGKPFKILAYPPIEGDPVSVVQMMGIKEILKQKGDVVLWCESAVKSVNAVSGLELDYIYFGSDHADFRPYTKEERAALRTKVGLNETFLVGCGGVNKRTKNFPMLIYAARELKLRGERGITFYCHTDPERPTMQGYRLRDMVKNYGVEDYFLWKEEIGENYYQGINYDTETIDFLGRIPDPTTLDEWQTAWNSYDFISRINCLDMYIDVSTVEGYGLFLSECMSMGVPVATPIDFHVRSEIFGPAAYSFQSTERETWETWHTGVRLVGMDQRVVADTILELKNNPELRKLHVEHGLEHIKQFTWDKTREQMNQKVRELHAKVL